ncbi:MAG: tyrosine-type recombinase/integrase [Acetobacteraceae bacterium]
MLSGVPIEHIGSLAALTTPACFTLGLKFFLKRDRVDKSSTRTVGMIAHTIRSIAKYHVRMSAPELDVLNNVTRRLSFRQQGMTEKNRHRLAQFCDATVKRFLCFPPSEMDRLLRADMRTRAQALLFSVVLALEILIHAPMRVGNLAGLRTDRDIRLPRERDGETAILIPRHLVKNGEPLEYLLPPATTRMLSIYIERVKPMLEAETSPFLFPGTVERPKRSDTMSKQVSHLVRSRLGIDFSPHLIRHLVAKLHADNRPGVYESLRRLLAHRSYDTTHNSYVGLETASANRLHTALITARRQTASPLPLCKDQDKNMRFRNLGPQPIKRRRKAKANFMVPLAHLNRDTD